MQNRKSVWAVFVLLWTLTLFFATLPLYASDIDPGANANSGISPDGGATVDDRVTTDEQQPDGYNTTIPGQNTTPDTNHHDGAHTNGNDHGTLGDKDGDGRIGRSAADNGDTATDTVADHAEQGGFSWGWLLFILLLVAVVIVILLLCMPRRG